MISSHMHLEYVYAAKVEIRKILQSSSYKTDLKEKLLQLESFNTEYWPVRWTINVKWTWKDLPSKVWYLPQIKELDFTKNNDDENKFESISHLIGKVNTIESLCLRSNLLTALPETLVFCQELKELKLENNEFEELPFFLKDMPKLETVYRYQNPCSGPMNRSMFVTIDKHKTRDQEEIHPIGNEEIVENAEEEEIEKSRIRNPSSLLQLSSKTICKQIFRNPMEIDQLDIPRQLKNLIYYSCDSLNFCYKCKKGLDPTYESNKCKITLPFFLGLTIVPVFCYSCDDCLEDVSSVLEEYNSKKLKKLSEDHLKVSVYNNEDVSCEKLHRKNCLTCRRGSRVKRALNNLMCHRRTHQY